VIAALLDKTALRRKCREERDKRLRTDGNDQYLQIKGWLVHDLEACVPSKPRAHCTGQRVRARGLVAADRPFS